MLLGKVQSDNIERRFGRIRQLSGSYYFISMRQLLESDKKLRTISLLKYSGISIAEIEQAVKDKSVSISAILTKAESLHAELLFNIIPTENDFAIIYYITGYCCRSMIKCNKCEACKDATIDTVHDAFVEADIPPDVLSFFNEINRGGLWKPTTAFFDVGIFAEIAYTNLKHFFLNGHDQRSIFKKMVSIAIFEGSVVSPWSVPALCHKGHEIVEGVAMRFFNCMCKNLMKNISERSSRSGERKIRKLTGKTN